MKIVVRMGGGLANRMFQYSYAEYLKQRGFDVFVDNSYKATEWKMEDISWERIFPNAPIRQAKAGLIFKLGGGYDLFSRIRKHFLPCFSSVKDFTFQNIASDADLKKYHYLIGVFANVPMIQEVLSIKQLFQFKEFTDEKNIAFARKISNENSVAIHIRKGKDYLKFTKYQNVCEISYYEKAIELIKEKVENPKFYVFTDNPEWVRDNLKNIEYQIVDWNPTEGYGNHFDMQLMTYCKHNIIANSTYSWWGAFLNNNPNKIVVSPQFWFNPEITDDKHVAQSMMLYKECIAL